MKQETNGGTKPKKIMYVCNPHKNTECTKTGCYLNKNADPIRDGCCTATSKIEHALLDIGGNPVADFKYLTWMMEHAGMRWKDAKKQVESHVTLRIEKERRRGEKIVNDGDSRDWISYVCDPHKNTECTKEACYLNNDGDRFCSCVSTSKKRMCITRH